jgi:uncharacterized membrane protein
LLTPGIKMAHSDVNLLLEFVGSMIAGLTIAIVVYRWRFRIQDWTKRWIHGTLTRRWASCFLGFLIIAYIVTFSTLSLLRHYNFHSHNDLAIHAQVMWNTNQGRWFDTTLLEDRPTNYLGHHFSPALLLLMPLYSLWPDAALLLVLQTVLLALGVVPVYAYARRETGSELVAVSVSAAYLLFPALHYSNLFDFHEIVLAVPLLSFAAYFVLTKRYRPFLVFLLLSLLVKEEVAFVAVAFALYILLVQRRYRLGIAMLLLAVGWGYLIMGVIMPTIAGHTYFPLGRYGYLGSSFGEVARSMLLDPLLVLRHLLVPAKLGFLLHLLVPVGLLPLLGFDTLLLALPTMLYLLLSDYEPQYSIQYHYTVPLIPLVFMATVKGIERLVRWKGRRVTVAVSALILVTSFLSYFLHGPGPLARYFNQNGQYNLWPHLASGYDALAAIPAGASVMTLEEFASHLAAREKIYIENESYLSVEYILQEHTARTATPRYPAFVPEGRELVYPYYETVFDKDGYWVQRYQDTVPISNELGVGFDYRLTLLAYQWRDESGNQVPVLKPGGYLDLIVAWRAEGQPPERYAFFVHLLDENSHRWAQVDQEVERGVYPTTLWEPGMVVADHYRLSLPWGTPPGEYQVLIGVYSLATGQRLSPTCSECSVRDNALLLGPVRVDKPDSAAPREAVSPQHRLDMRLNEELELTGYDLGMTEIQPGGTIPLILTWRALSDVANEYTIATLLDQGDGAGRLRCLEEPVGLAYRPDNWEVSEVVRDWHDLRVPPDAPPGRYEVLMEVLKAGATVGEASLGHLEIQGRPRLFAAPEIQHPLEARVGEGALLLGYDVSNDELRPGDSLRLTLYWQALDEMPISYTVFTHLLDAEAHVWGQSDSIPLRGEAPTTSWVPGEIIADPYDVVVDPDAPPGDYVFEIGMYDATSGQRLTVSADGLRAEGDRLLLGEVKILP